MLTIGFVGMLLMTLVTFIAMPSERFSQLENRVLQAMPKLSWQSIVTGAFTEQTERFIADQFPFREQWVALKSFGEQLRGQRENNGIYKGKNGYLFEKFSEPNQHNIERYVAAINAFSEKNASANITLMLAPTSIGVYPERLPPYASSYSQRVVNDDVAERLVSSISFIDGFAFLTDDIVEGDRQLYFRTDHHWTTHGAYLAYEAYAKYVGWAAWSREQFNVETVSTSFLGSYHTRSQFVGLTPDHIEAYFPKQPIETEVHIVDKNETLHGLYDESYLNTKDQYSYFLSGVHPLMQLSTALSPEAVEQQKLLVIKDSYAHNVIPFLTLHVPELHVIDIRFYNGSLSDYMQDHQIDEVLILFNTTTFVDNVAVLKMRL